MTLDLARRTPKQFHCGTHRIRAPRDTLADYRRFMPAMGITRLANVTGLDRIGLPVCVAVRPNSRALATSQGKGETLEHALVSALMESIESWHAERIEAPLRHAPLHDLQAGGARVADLDGLALRVDASFDARRAIAWIEGQELMDGGRRWLPYESVALNFVRQPGHLPCFLESSNGLASGNHPAEAVLHGLYEVVERDAVTLWEFLPPAPRAARQLDLATVREPALRRVLDVLDAAGIVLGAWDLTSDVGVPTFTCSIVEDPESPHWRPVPMFSGHGAHLQAEIALSRAIHEAIQSRLTAISGSRDDLFPTDYLKAGQREDHARVIRTLREPGGTRAFRSGALPVGESIEADVATVLARLRAVGCESAMAVDLSRPGIGIPVFKVVVPGLEPYHTPLYRANPRARHLRNPLA